MNSSVPKTFDPNNFSLSDSAIEHFSSTLTNQDCLGVRFSVIEASGCSGYTYELDYVHEKESSDLIFEFKDVSIFIDKESFQFLKGTKVDFYTEGVNEGVRFLNPNVKAVCGCGESFEIEI
ncbi:MAG: iron-sulfur cluster assembly protein IscA [Gammaproteobacteria bacterium]|jgi:iron-sulfur cluster assembly protein|nr:iron-sulfur cluster assembly protein IscA [Gammaproteobacteria bacterium]HJL95549.1 iron-sulfur cluster assembly accessory protein [SAR86 cluster bacterium]|tara:strand:- start:18482 stop:18844 length:363 start_codon:yes stop_codon:yes gene_type:complete